MLVKLGDVWVDPSIVAFIEPELGRVTVVTTEGRFTNEGDVDAYAAIINNAGQSYGGSDEAPEGE